VTPCTGPGRRPLTPSASGGEQPEIDKAVGRFDFVTTDFEGLPRSGTKDVGADEHDG
jgi:hypothetical protein